MPSTAISSYGYDPDRRELEVRFVRGSGYVYEDVSPQEFAAFEVAPSKGAVLNTVIKPGRRYRRLPDEETAVDREHLRSLWKRSLRQEPSQD